MPYLEDEKGVFRMECSRRRAKVSTKISEGIVVGDTTCGNRAVSLGRSRQPVVCSCCVAEIPRASPRNRPRGKWEAKGRPDESERHGVRSSRKSEKKCKTNALKILTRVVRGIILAWGIAAKRFSNCRVDSILPNKCFSDQYSHSVHVKDVKLHPPLSQQ
ncbi:hypothetical protein K0M31_003583 [Melipona bicolor]|uniref:Uncharacterized protein n=1 Tax=Melipona bicolor TaxID=60889 RepID=A0AA40FZB2_9HYME|nr:hypothetical protein K0M31_003583 [Melipona bicolor]